MSSAIDEYLNSSFLAICMRMDREEADEEKLMKI
jgi:hypothetical protein